MIIKGVSSSEVDGNQHQQKRGRVASQKQELRVTKILQQVKRADRYSIYINDTYSFSLHEYQLADSGLRVGKVLQSEDLDNFATESQFGKAYERALNYVMIRPRSEKEIKDYLTRTFLYPKPKSFVDKSGQRHFKPQTVDKEQTEIMIIRVVERLQEKGYINDEAFAKAWVSSRLLHKKPSRRRLNQELLAKGVSQPIIIAVLQDADMSEVNNLKELIAKKRRQTKYQDDDKLTQYLLRQGFQYDDIKQGLQKDGS